MSFSKHLFDKLGFILFLVFALISGLIIFSKFGKYYDFQLFLIFFFSTLISLVGFLSKVDSLGISLNKIFFIFHFLFFGIAPIVQFKFGTTFFGGKKLDLVFFKELGLILISIQIFYILSYFLIEYFFRNQFLKLSFKQNVNKSNFWIYLILSVICVVVFLYLIKFNFNVLIFKPKYQWLKYNTNFGLVGYSLLLVFRTVPFLILLLYKLNFKQKTIIKDLVLLLCLLIVAFPIAITRGLAATYYLPLLIVYFPFFKRKHIFSLFFISFFLIVFPILNYTRNYNIDDIDMGFQLFNSPHMDAFQNMGNLYSQKIITNGRQLLGSILFFIQESSWSNRPVGTGQMLAEINNYNYSNISMPLWGEGYANFGIWGVFIFVFFTAFMNSFLDFQYANSNNVFLKCLFLFFIGFEFYFLRGDLFSSFKKLDAFLLALGLVYIISYLSKCLFLSKK